MNQGFKLVKRVPPMIVIECSKCGGVMIVEDTTKPCALVCFGAGNGHQFCIVLHRCDDPSCVGSVTFSPTC